MKNNLKTKKIAAIIAAVALAIGIGVFVYSTTVTAQVTSLGQIANSVGKLYPQSIPATGNLTNVNGINMAKIASSDQSVTIDRQTGVSKSKIETGRATLELKHGVTQSSDHIVAATVTNNGKNTIYLNSLIMFGQTSEGMEPLNAYVVDASYSPEVFGDIPKPAVVKPVAITPGQSYSGYIVGKWSMSNLPIQSFSVAAVYVYDINAQGYVADNNWSISVAETKLPL